MSKIPLRLEIKDNAICLHQGLICRYAYFFENTEGFEAWVNVGKWMSENNYYIPESNMVGLMPEVKKSLRGEMPYKYEIAVRNRLTKFYTVKGNRALTLEEEENIENEGIEGLPKGFLLELEQETEESDYVDVFDLSEENDED